MIRRQKIYDEEGKGVWSMTSSQDFEYADPVKFYSEWFIGSRASLMIDFFLLKKAPVPRSLIEKFSWETAKSEWDEKEAEICATEVPEALINLLKSTSKKEQVQLLKNLNITPEQLIAFIFRAWKEGYSFSQYHSEHHPKDVDNKEMPKLVEVRKNEVKTVGETNLSNGKLKQILEHRKVLVAKFFDKADNWHCFFVTYNSLGGKETWQEGQPHYHYISDKFGIPREKVVEELKKREYKLGNLPHIALDDYGIHDDDDDKIEISSE
jgi:hypothetical protein